MSVWNLFITFLKIGLLSIGGGYAIIPLIQEQVVVNNSWISEKVFTDIITISQMTPGPLAVNTSTFVGLQIGGIAGALAATIGCISCGVMISLLLYTFFQTHEKSLYVMEMQKGLKSASLGLIISAAFTIVLLALYGTAAPGTDFLSLNGIAVFIFSAMLLMVRKGNVHPVAVMLISGVAGFVLYR